MLEKLGEALKKATDKIAGAIFVDKKMIEEVCRELQRGLISADVNVHLVKEITDKIKEKASDEKIKGIEKKDQIIKILYDTILEIIGGEKHELKLKEGKNEQTKIFLLGLYGAGKTTTASKLGLYYSKRGKKVALLGLDVHRPAAADQLEQLAKQNNLAYFIDKNEKSAVKIYKKFKPEFEDYDVLIIDTAGRHSLDKELVEEIKDLNKTIKPDYKILVIQADIGQAAKNQAAEFQKALEVNGVIITRMDSTAKAGGALTACHETKAPVFFIGTGEKSQDIETFNPQAFISRILGMGDLEGLLEKVHSAIDADKQKSMKTRLEKGEFDLRDFQEQIKSMSSMGSMSKMLDMIPGLGSVKDKLKDSNVLGVQEEKIKKWQHAINSMTQEEIKNPEIIEKQTTRLGRIAKGSGTTTSDIRQLIKQYKMIKEFVKGGVSESDLQAGGMNQAQMMKLAKKFGKKMRM